MLKKYYSRFGGILSGGIYGLLMRIVFGVGFKSSGFDFADLFSITFIWIVPIIIGLTPLIFSTSEDLDDIPYRIFKPFLSVLTFFILCFWTGHEDIICIFIISIPFILVSGIAGVFFGGFIIRIRKRRGIVYTLFLLPLLTGLIEPHISTPNEKFETTSTVIVKANKSEIWKNIVRVNKIEETEYQKGLFNYAGIPRPLYAELDKDSLGGIRIGHFEGGLKFHENIIKWDMNNSVTFDIKIIPSSINKTIFEQHMLNGEHFNFLNATYSLKEIEGGKILLQLTTKYQLDTKINFYGEFWGKLLLSDFQNRLLAVIKKRCEK